MCVVYRVEDQASLVRGGPEGLAYQEEQDVAGPEERMEWVQASTLGYINFLILNISTSYMLQQTKMCVFLLMWNYWCFLSSSTNGSLITWQTMYNNVCKLFYCMYSHTVLCLLIFLCFSSDTQVTTIEMQYPVKEEEENAMHNTVVIFSSNDNFTLKQVSFFNTFWIRLVYFSIHVRRCEMWSFLKVSSPWKQCSQLPTGKIRHNTELYFFCIFINNWCGWGNSNC